jgi:hypothetical protein
MQRFRLLSVVIVIALGSSAFLVRADDTAAQAAARAALMQQMNQMDTEQAATNTAPAAPPQVTSPAPAPAPATPPPVAEPAPAPSMPAPVVAPAPVVMSPPLIQPTPQFSTNGLVITTDTNQYPVKPAPVPITPQTNMVATPQPPVAQPTPPVAPPTGFAPITAPPLPISQEKQQALQDLLSKYMANQISRCTISTIQETNYFVKA